MAAKVIIYGKSGCPYTEKAREAYGEKADSIDVNTHADKLDEMLKHSKGTRKVPVIVEGKKITVGYGGT